MHSNYYQNYGSCLEKKKQVHGPHRLPEQQLIRTRMKKQVTQ